MTTRLEVRRLSTPRRNGAGRAERRREIWGITTPRTVTPGSIGRRCSGYLSCSFGPQRLSLDRSDAAGAFVEPVGATPLRQGEAPPAPCPFARWERQFLPVGFTLRLPSRSFRPQPERLGGLGASRPSVDSRAHSTPSHGELSSRWRLLQSEVSPTVANPPPTKPGPECGVRISQPTRQSGR
jgi:hypothetical protein